MVSNSQRRPGASTPEIHAAIDSVRRLAEVFALRRVQLAASVGLTEGQWGVLEEIATLHFMPSMFARRQQSSAAAVSKMLRQLIDKGLIAASVGKDDGRQRTYVLTARGKDVMNRLRDHRQVAIDRIWSQLDPGALRTFTDFAGALTTRLETYAEANQASSPARGK